MKLVDKGYKILGEKKKTKFMVLLKKLLNFKRMNKKSFKTIFYIVI